MPVKKKKKKRRRGKPKGNGFERKTKKQILAAFSKFGITDNDAFRSILSGGHKESAGDISLSAALAKLFPYAAECKFYAKVDLYQALVPWKKMGPANKFKKWWTQTLIGAAKNKKLYPLLVFRANNKPDMCMLYSHHFLPVIGLMKSPLRKKLIPSITIPTEEGDLYIFKFSVLLKLLVNKAPERI